MQHMPQWCPAPETLSFTTVPVSELHRHRNMGQVDIVTQYVQGYFRRINQRLLQNRSKRIYNLPLGIIPPDILFGWLGTPTKTSHKSRPERELDGDYHSDIVHKYTFVEENVNGIPLAPSGWFNVEYHEKKRLRRKLHFRVTTITFIYNEETWELDASFTYIAVTPIQISRQQWEYHSIM